MFGRVGTVVRTLSSRRAAQRSFVGRGLDEFFENGARVPTKTDQTGRAWAASELRQKSWEELQQLWYMVLKERNVLASQKEECNRLGITAEYFSNVGRDVKCRKTMARIRTVLGERQIAWEKAQQGVEAATQSLPADKAAAPAEEAQVPAEKTTAPSDPANAA
ncbi:54S ribosomal protein L4 mitochondrial [Coemansia sp. RSA 552]|nr:54S ribosomal protein L4 mitochondrial [Coemansia sp. RSA 552]